MFSQTIAALEKFDNQHDFERMSADILNASGYGEVVLIAPRGGSDGGKDITFITEAGETGLACVTLRKDIDRKFDEDFSQRKVGEFAIYILFCTAYLTASQKLKYSQYCRNTLSAKFVPEDIETLRSLLDSSLKPIRERYLRIQDDSKGVNEEALAKLRNETKGENQAQTLSQKAENAIKFAESELYVKRHDDELYAEYIEKWVKYTDLNNWTDWTGHWILASSMPKISYKQLGSLEDLELWLLSTIWPQRYPELDAAFENFRLILHDLVQVFHRHTSSDGDSSRTDKFYQQPYDGSFDQNLYDEKIKEYKLHLELLGDLMLELTRATNYICDKVRQFIDPTFRIQEGAVLVAFSFGDFHRTEYRSNERVLHPYPGLEQFEQDRKNRDIDCSQYGPA